MAVNTKEMRAEFNNLCKQVRGLNLHVHTWLVKALGHYKEHGDYTLLRYAVERSWTSGMKRDAMIVWVRTHGKLSFEEIGNGKVNVKVMNKNRDRIDIVAARKDIFFRNINKEEKAKTDFDLEKTCKNIGERLFKEGVNLDDAVALIGKYYGAAKLKADEKEKPVADGMDNIPGGKAEQVKLFKNVA